MPPPPTSDFASAARSERAAIAPMPRPVRPRKLRRERALLYCSMGFMGGGVVWGQDVPSTDWDCKSQPRGSWAVDEFVEVDEGGAEDGVGGLLGGAGDSFRVGFLFRVALKVAGEGLFQHCQFT